MDRESVPAWGGIAACLATVVLVVVPYGVLEASNVAVYYGVGFAGPQIVALLAIVATMAMLAGVKRRSDPHLAAGAAVTISSFAAVLSLAWAFPAGSVAGGFEISATFDYHRWALVVSTGSLALLAGWYASLVVPMGDGGGS